MKVLMAANSALLPTLTTLTGFRNGASNVVVFAGAGLGVPVSLALALPLPPPMGLGLTVWPPLPRFAGALPCGAPGFGLSADTRGTKTANKSGAMKRDILPPHCGRIKGVPG